MVGIIRDCVSCMIIISRVLARVNDRCVGFFFKTITLLNLECLGV